MPWIRWLRNVEYFPIPCRPHNFKDLPRETHISEITRSVLYKMSLPKKALLQSKYLNSPCLQRNKSIPRNRRPKNLFTKSPAPASSKSSAIRSLHTHRTFSKRPIGGTKPAAYTAARCGLASSRCRKKRPSHAPASG